MEVVSEMNSSLQFTLLSCCHLVFSFQCVSLTRLTCYFLISHPQRKDEKGEGCVRIHSQFLFLFCLYFCYESIKSGLAKLNPDSRAKQSEQSKLFSRKSELCSSSVEFIISMQLQKHVLSHNFFAFVFPCQSCYSTLHGNIH